MKAARPLKPFHWVAIDLLALLMVVGWGLITYALAVGAWRPLGPVTPDYWTLLAFPVAIGVVSCCAVLLGWQLNAIGLLGSEASHRPRLAGEESSTREKTFPSLSPSVVSDPIALEPRIRESFLVEAESEEAERIPAIAGR